MPIVDEATVMPAANSLRYPRSSISGMRTDPIDAVSEAEEPEIPPKSMLAKTLTRPRPPRSRPASSMLKSMSREVI